ncbi:hypothetical protein SAY87_002006 [Trapa incisa]|uniref:Uncharacterized protein n=1 Tax=Trapa incisa TaxID=236973 RepID=A0AAN7PTB8_9MYRT|nr:hypothetical protein SAY87_002006 [Trapa incisa]
MANLIEERGYLSGHFTSNRASYGSDVAQGPRLRYLEPSRLQGGGPAALFSQGTPTSECVPYLELQAYEKDRPHEP